MWNPRTTATVTAQCPQNPKNRRSKAKNFSSSALCLRLKLPYRGFPELPPKNLRYGCGCSRWSAPGRERSRRIVAHFLDKGATMVDPTVRNAREIPASEFRMFPELITQVENLWGNEFFPTRDTLETDLVGTFLLGLGDTSQTIEIIEEEEGEIAGALEIKEGGQWGRYTVNFGEWVAFYPDVDHAVREIASGYSIGRSLRSRSSVSTKTPRKSPSMER
ncbi:hypothetical protein C8F04DRAFT_229065 [Mycena alexandri]|uniref:Prolyl 4-hydroxylase alpha subunit Fe(2+) 2OG dioxygenase domain-containing protein n=1 Tax=Mycena alexandri TaxID=1745969 RepID=A0AAD6XD29_9AGAR|nr:hypothetical protein C8F04DRAFT_229065 [Mycena alexandri]